MESTPSLRVGAWTVEPALHRISCGGRAVRLEPKVMAVLVRLAERPGEVVTREALLAAAWPGVIVGDDSLTQVVIKLRKALGDSPEHPAYVETIAKGGYRLVVPVERVGGDAAGARPPASRGRAIAAGSAALLLLAVAAWRLAETRSVPAVDAAAAPREAQTAAAPTLTVKPFEPLGNDPHAALLAQGLAADLTTDLSKVRGLEVVHAPSSPVRYVVTGTVQGDDARVRINVHLTDARTGKPLWSERFDRPIGDFFAIQEELGPKILQILPAKVSEAELHRVSQRYTRNLEAYESFVRGQAGLQVRERAANEEARERFRHAIALDPAFARAYAGLALTYAAEHRHQWTAEGPAALERAFEIARTAHQMNPDTPETYWVLALVHVERREHEEALGHLRAAVRLHPSFADGYALMAGVHTYLGRPAESVAQLRTALRLNPQANYLYFLILGRAYLFLGDLEQARINLEQALQRNPSNVEARVYMAAVQQRAGNRAAASWQAEEIRTLHPGFSAAEWVKTYPMSDAGQRSQLLDALAAAGL